MPGSEASYASCAHPLSFWPSSPWPWFCPPSLVAQHQPTIAQYLKPGMPIELVSADKVDRIAWIAYEEGKRNVYTAVGPAFRPCA